MEIKSAIKILQVVNFPINLSPLNWFYSTITQFITLFFYFPSVVTPLVNDNTVIHVSVTWLVAILRVSELVESCFSSFLRVSHKIWFDGRRFTSYKRGTTMLWCNAFYKCYCALFVLYDTAVYLVTLSIIIILGIWEI